MRILVASSPFKGTFSAQEACEAMLRGVREVHPGADAQAFPLADGGEGTLETLLAAHDGQRVSTYVRGPRGAEIRADWGLVEEGTHALIQASKANGLLLVPEHARNPMLCTTYGVGQLVVEALERGCKRITLTLGDSATVDAGLGMAMALGYSLRDAKDLEVGATGGVMREITHVVTDGVHGRLARAKVRALYDVENPLLGPQGAVPVYAAQKGADSEQQDLLEEGLAQLAGVVERDLRIDVKLKEAPGAGAAGGLGWGCAAWLGADLASGAEAVLKVLGFARALEAADLVVLGEGSWDAQSREGKATGRAWAMAREAKVRCKVVCARGEGDDALDASTLGKGGRRLEADDLAELARLAAGGEAAGVTA